MHTSQVTNQAGAYRILLAIIRPTLPGTYRGYYMARRGYEIYILVFKKCFTSEHSERMKHFSTREDEFLKSN